MTATDRTRWLGLAVLSVGVAMIIVDATIVNVALPSIMREFNLALADAEWINSIYSLVFAALLITLGKVGDMYGRLVDDGTLVAVGVLHQCPNRSGCPDRRLPLGEGDA